MAAFIYKERVNQCYQLKITDPFDELTNCTLKNLATANSVPVEYIIPPFITAVSHFLNKSEINSWGSWYQPSIIYSSTVGFTGTNKTAAMDAVRNAIMDVESANGVAEVQSRINQSATVESLLKQLNNDSRQIQLWDELKTWQSSLGLYKTGAASDYDTTIYLTAYNGGTLKRQTCNSNISIMKPVVNICGMAHPGEICKCLDEERKNSNSNDGLYSRFLMCMPQPEFRDANVTEDTFTDAPSISRLLYVVDKLHKQKKIYIYDTEAKQVAIRYYNEQQQYLRENHSSDTYTSAWEAKNHAITPDFVSTMKEALDRNLNTKEEFIQINLQNAKKSIELSQYFLKHKKLLSGYINSGFIEPMIKSQLVRKILLYPGGLVPCNAITKSTRFTADQVKAEMKMICEFGLGETIHEKPQAGGRLMFILNKISTNNLSLDEIINITSTLSKLA
ncbi:Hypothetical predicted protein [Mytilus galloprovincialis]|uniref:Uncharacterized protein n=1 Tax=Mytilus galloprovincialis TaxID=29158 RepID=A0A8B6E3V4_MYTGA|nr:Hypothetical predicted protein [Mytilus galloprovincialis]